MYSAASNSYFFNLLRLALIAILTSYLENRQQLVAASDYNIVKFRVPQGSNLGPSLFLLFISVLSIGISWKNLRLLTI